jgi:ribosomal protein S18 acetylase RimI-like enzyme
MEKDKNWRNIMSEFIIRHYLPETDLSPLSRMLTEIESVDRDGEETSEEYLSGMSEWPNFDPGQNVWVAEWGGDLVGYGQVLPRTESPSTIYVVVRPSQRRQGLGSQLLALTLSRLDASKHKKILIYATGHNTASNAFLKHHGFEVNGTSGVMVAPIGGLPLVEIPPAYSLRRYPELGDPQIVVQALDQCYKDMVGHHQNVTSADRYMNYYGEEGIHLLFDERDNLIGICAGKPEGKADNRGRGASDLLDAPGLVNEYRQREFQHFLALAVIHWLREKGTRPITLEYWGDDEKAIAIYRGLGFELVSEQIAYHKELA